MQATPQEEMFLGITLPSPDQKPELVANVSVSVVGIWCSI